jgi:NTP pyrophosphatase (non-canonical NTP hydrolase)
MSELTKEITEYIGRETLQNLPLNKKELADEIADVEIMLEQLKMILGNHSEVQVRKIFKIKRLQDRLSKKE